MGFHYDNQGYGSYLVYKLEDNEVIDEISLNMLSNNNIDGLLSAKFTQMNNNIYIRYDISSLRTPVSRFIKDYVNSGQVINMLIGITDAIESVEDYMLDLSSFVFDINYIFVDRSGNSRMVCLPVSKVRTQLDFADFFKKIITSLKLSDNYNLIGQILNYLNSHNEFSVHEFRDLLIGLKNNAGAVVKNSTEVSKQISNNEQNQTGNKVQNQTGYIPQSQTVYKPQNKTVYMPQNQTTKQQEVQKNVNPKNSNTTFAIPNVPGNRPIDLPRQSVDQNTSLSSDNEKLMSLWYLLTNFSHENLNIYKSQRENKKKASAQTANKNGKMRLDVPNSQANPYANNQVNQYVNSSAQNNQNNAPAIQNNQIAGNLYNNPDGDFGATMDYSESADDSTMDYYDDTADNIDNRNVYKKRAFLISISNGKRIEINKSVFHIGRENNYSDFLISENRRISHKHADIVERNGEYFIKDDNSKWHTYVNNSGVLPPYEEYKLKSGDRIRLANEEFDFIVE